MTDTKKIRDVDVERIRRLLEGLERLCGVAKNAEQCSPWEYLRRPVDCAFAEVMAVIAETLCRS